MAYNVSCNMTEFKKVSGFPDGARKPVTKINTTDTASNIAALIQTNVNADLVNMVKGESVCIVVSIGDEIVNE